MQIYFTGRILWNMHNNCCLEAEKKVDSACQNKLLYFPFSFLKLIGFNSITKYAFYSKLRFEWNLWGIQGFHMYETVSAACRFVVTTKRDDTLYFQDSY